MPIPLTLPTPDQLRQITAYIRAGGFPHVAAQAAGVPPRTFERWLRRGNNPHGDPAYRSFAIAVREATGQARLRAEIAVLDAKPLDWLRYGPGREVERSPGWTAAVRAPTGAGRGVNALDVPEVRAFIATLLHALAAHPELRETVRACAAQFKPRRRRPDL